MRLVLIIAVCQMLIAGVAEARGAPPEVVIQDPFIELHTGPGRGYPIFYVAERGETVTLLKRRTQWFKVRVPRGEEGWVHGAQLERTLDKDGQPFEVPDLITEREARGRWEVGAFYGDFGGANAMAGFGALRLTDNLAVEVSIGQALGRYSESTLASVTLTHTWYPERRISPYFALGTGSIHTIPKSTLVSAVDRMDSQAHAGLGLRVHLGPRVLVRAEYKSYVVFTSRDDNEEVKEWKAGFSFYF